MYFIHFLIYALPIFWLWIWYRSTTEVVLRYLICKFTIIVHQLIIYSTHIFNLAYLRFPKNDLNIKLFLIAHDAKFRRDKILFNNFLPTTTKLSCRLKHSRQHYNFFAMKCHRCLENVKFNDCFEKNVEDHTSFMDFMKKCLKYHKTFTFTANHTIIAYT